MFAISEALDGQLVLLIGGLITFIGLVNVWFLNKIKKDTTDTSLAVNHKKPGEATIARQVDKSAEDIVELKYDMQHVKEDIAELKIALNNIQGAIENLLQSHVITKSKLEELLNIVPKRKTD